MTFSHAISRSPGRSIVAGLSGTSQSLPIYEKALQQHHLYLEALKQCGLEILNLDATEDFPDAIFVEDVAVLTPTSAILTVPAAPSRKEESTSILPVLEKRFSVLERIKAPGTLEGGDVLQVGSHFFVGLSRRTNADGAHQLIALLEKQHLSGSVVPVSDFLHLKTGVTWVAADTLVATGEFITHPAFQDFTIFPVPADESAAANCLRINEKIIMPARCPKTRHTLDTLDVEILEVDISEFAKIDGGLSCLSLRY